MPVRFLKGSAPSESAGLIHRPEWLWQLFGPTALIGDDGIRPVQFNFV